MAALLCRGASAAPAFSYPATPSASAFCVPEPPSSNPRRTSAHKVRLHLSAHDLAPPDRDPFEPGPDADRSASPNPRTDALRECVRRSRSASRAGSRASSVGGLSCASARSEDLVRRARAVSEGRGVVSATGELLVPGHDDERELSAAGLADGAGARPRGRSGARAGGGGGGGVLEDDLASLDEEIQQILRRDVT